MQHEQATQGLAPMIIARATELEDAKPPCGAGVLERFVRRVCSVEMPGKDKAVARPGWNGMLGQMSNSHQSSHANDALRSSVSMALHCRHRWTSLPRKIKNR